MYAKAALGLLITLLCYTFINRHILSADSSKRCQFPAIYNFGDSNSDTGADSAVFGRVPPPYGETFFGKPAGRYSDGRLIIDFLAERLGLPYLSAYLDSLGTSFHHGANFAVNGATIGDATGALIDDDFSPISLKKQLMQFKQLKDRTMELYAKGKTNGLPKPDDFPNSLYIIDIGQNDLHFKLELTTQDQAIAIIPELINQTTIVIQKLYQEGARSFWIHSTGPIGCLPSFVVNSSLLEGDTDEFGCIQSYNEVAKDFNKQLKDAVVELRSQFQDATFTFVDIYSAKYTLFKDPKKLGFVDPHGHCCKHPDDQSLDCFKIKEVNGTTVYAASCSNPSEYIFWERLHYTEAANHWVADHIWDGSYSDPPLSITEARLSAAL